jgi:hypothetical protein
MAGMRRGLRSGLAAALTLGGLVGGAVPSAPVAASEAFQVGGSCLVGRWDSTDVQTYFNSLFAATPSLRNARVDGTMNFTFGPGGQFAEQVDNLVVTADTDMGAWVQSMSGSLGGDYAESGGLVTFSNYRSVTMTTSVTLDGQLLISGADLSSLAMDGETSQMAYRCEGDRLLLTPEIPDRAPAPMVFQRCDVSGRACQVSAPGTAMRPAAGPPEYDEPIGDYPPELFGDPDE